MHLLMTGFDLVSSPGFMRVSAKDKFEKPTKRVNELWQTDFAHLKVRRKGNRTSVRISSRENKGASIRYTLVFRMAQERAGCIRNHYICEITQIRYNVWAIILRSVNNLHPHHQDHQSHPNFHQPNRARWGHRR